MASTIFSAALRATRVVSNPSSAASTMSVAGPGSSSNVPSPPVTVLWIT